MTLVDLTVGESGTIVSVALPRLESMGIVAGAVVTVLRRNGTSMHIKIKTTEWAIRNSTAESVKVARIK